MTETGVQVLRDIIDDRAYDGVQNWATSAKERAAFETERVEHQAILTAILAQRDEALVALGEMRAEKCWGDTPACFTQAAGGRPGTCVCVLANLHPEGETP